MVYRLRPLELKLECDEGPFRLGERIALDLELTPNADVEVREARVDLVCEERHSRTGSAISIGMGGRATIQGGNPLIMTDYIPASTTVKQSKESYVHSTVVFLKDARLSSGQTTRYTPKLDIQPVPPRHLDDANGLESDATSSLTFKWTVVASVNIARGRDPRKQRAVKVTLPSASDNASSDSGPRLINKPPRSHAKPPTGKPGDSVRGFEDQSRSLES